MGIKVKIQLTSLFFINENFTNKYNIEALDILSVFIIICGIYIIISKNPIVSILFLIGLFGGISSYLILTGLSFIGLSYLIIYIGAVSILFLFILMLINIRISELQNNNKNSVTLALIILIFVNYSIFPIFPYSTGVSNNYYRNINYMLYKVSSDQDNINTSGKNNDLYFASSND
jgi:NADH-ubiquinone oxidoreductase chain 6